MNRQLELLKKTKDPRIISHDPEFIKEYKKIFLINDITYDTYINIGKMEKIYPLRIYRENYIN